MPTFEITSPDGKVYEVTGPEGSTPDQALAQVQAEAQGVTVSHWIADEGWGVFSETNLVRIGQPMLGRLAERFGRVIVISHQAPISEVCDTRLTVEACAEHGSRLKAAA